MNRSELLSHIKKEVALAAATKNKDAVNMYLVVNGVCQQRCRVH